SIAGAAVWEVAQSVLQQILAVASRLLEETPQRLTPRDGAIVAKGGRRVSYEQIGLATLAGESPRPIVAWAAHTSLDAQPSFAATFAEVDVDVETGLVSVLKLVEAVDCG